MLYGTNKEAKDHFYKSATSRKNKEALVELASQVYSYLNGTISEFADVKDYVFRVWSQVTVDKKNGAIVGQPLFDVEIYKYVGRVTAQTVEVKDYVLTVAFIGKKDDQFITPFMNRALKRAKTATKHVQLEMYADPRTSPKALKEKVVGAFPTLIVDGEPYPVKTKIDQETGAVQAYIDDEAGAFNINSKNDVLSFLSKKSGLKPEILGLTTAFQPVDHEIKKISQRVKESAKVGETDFLKYLGLENIFQRLEDRLGSVKRQGLSNELQQKMKAARAQLDEEKDKYQKLKVEHEVTQDDLRKLDDNLEKKMITFETYEVSRMRSLTNWKKIEQELVNLQARVKGDLTNKIEELLSDASVKQGREVEKK